MKSKTLLICMTAVIMQLCFFTGCSDDNSKVTPENESSVSETEPSETKSSETSQDSSEIVPVIKISAETDAEKNIIMPEMEIEYDTTETSRNISVNGNYEKITVTEIVPDKNNAPDETTTGNIFRETNAETVFETAPSESVTTVTEKEAIELPEIPFD